MNIKSDPLWKIKNFELRSKIGKVLMILTLRERVKRYRSIPISAVTLWCQISPCFYFVSFVTIRWNKTQNGAVFILFIYFFLMIAKSAHDYRWKNWKHPKAPLLCFLSVFTVSKGNFSEQGQDLRKNGSRVKAKSESANALFLFFLVKERGSMS